MPWTEVPQIQFGMMDGLAWAHSSAALPRKLENCFVERGRIVARTGHTLKQTESNGDKVLSLNRPSSGNKVASVKVTGEGTVEPGKVGTLDSGTFVAKNVYSTGTVTVSGNTVTPSSPDILKLVNISSTCHIRYVYTGSTYSDWLVIQKVNDTDDDGEPDTLTVVAAPGNATDADYELCIGSNWANGKTVKVGNRYYVTVKGSAPVVYDSLIGKAWQAGIPKPSAPTGSYAGFTPDAGTYKYRVSYVNEDGDESDSQSKQLTVVATADKYDIKLHIKTPFSVIPITSCKIWRVDPGDATEYLLCQVPVLSRGETLEIEDTASNGNDDGATEFVAGDFVLSPFFMDGPTGAFYEPDGDTGWISYACAYVLNSGEVGPVSERLTVEKTTAGHRMTLTVPDDMDITYGKVIFSTLIKETANDAEEANLYKLIGLEKGRTEWAGITGEDDMVNQTVPAPLETTGWSGSVNTNDVFYAAGRVFVPRSDGKVSMSGVVYYDIGYYGTGLDQPNYWQSVYDCGGPGEVHAGCYYNGNVYVLKSDSMWVLNTSDTPDNPDLWYFARVNESMGCSQDRMCAAGYKGIYSIWTAPDGKTYIVRFSGRGEPYKMDMIQETVDSISTWYAMASAGGYIFISTDQGVLVLDENGDRWHVDTGVTPKTFHVEGATLYSGDDDGKVYEWYSKAIGTKGDEDAYTATVRTGAFFSGSRIHAGENTHAYIRVQNDDTATKDVTVKVSTDGYGSFVQTPAAADWSATIEVKASAKDFIEDAGLSPRAHGETFGLQFTWTGGYGEFMLLGYGTLETQPYQNTIGEL